MLANSPSLNTFIPPEFIFQYRVSSNLYTLQFRTRVGCPLISLSSGRHDPQLQDQNHHLHSHPLFPQAVVQLANYRAFADMPLIVTTSFPLVSQQRISPGLDASECI
jgi:hypothetical protein